MDKFLIVTSWVMFLLPLPITVTHRFLMVSFALFWLFLKNNKIFGFNKNQVIFIALFLSSFICSFIIKPRYSSITLIYINFVYLLFACYLVNIKAARKLFYSLSKMGFLAVLLSSFIVLIWARFKGVAPNALSYYLNFNPNKISTYVLILLPFFDKIENKHNNWTTIAMYSTLFLFLIMCDSLWAIFVLFAIISFKMYSLFYNSHKPLMVCIPFVAIMAVYMNYNVLIDHACSRIEALKVSIRLFLKHPIFGCGVNQWIVEGEQYWNNKCNYPETKFNQVLDHNRFTFILAERGLFSLAFLPFFLNRLFKCLNESKDDLVLIGIYLLLSLGYQSVGFSNYNLGMTEFYALFAVLNILRDKL